MDSPTYLAMLRRRMVDVDQSAQRFTDSELWQNTADVVLDFTVRAVTNYGPYTVSTTNGFSGTIDDTDGLMTMAQVAWVLLNDLYRDAVNRGELGGSWKSGLEEESTSANQKAYKEALDDLKSTVDQLMMHKAKHVFAKRQQ